MTPARFTHPAFVAALCDAPGVLTVNVHTEDTWHLHAQGELSGDLMYHFVAGKGEAGMSVMAVDAEPTDREPEGFAEARTVIAGDALPDPFHAVGAFWFLLARLTTT